VGGELAHAAGAAADRVLEHIRTVTDQSAGVVTSIEATSTALEAVDSSTRRIEETVAAQRAATRASEATLTAATERLLQIAERRTAPRVTLDEPLRAVLQSGTGAPIETRAVDVSMGGALFEGRPGLGEGPWQLTLFLPGDAAPMTCSALLVRRTGTNFGVSFSGVADADLLRLDTAIARHHRHA
jgi:hypothetical protein